MQIQKNPEVTVPTSPDVSLTKPRGVISGIAEVPLVLVCLVSKCILREDFDMASALIATNFESSIVPNIAKHENGQKFDLVIKQSHVKALSDKFEGFTLIADYDPFALDDIIVRIRGTPAAKQTVCESVYTMAIQSQNQGWTLGSQECYQRAFEKADMGKEFVERVIQEADVQTPESDEVLSMRLLEDCKTNQAVNESHLLNMEFDCLNIGSAQGGKVAESQEWTRLVKNDTQSATERPADQFSRTLAFLQRSVQFGKLADFMEKALMSEEKKNSTAFLDSVNTQASVEFADLENAFYNWGIRNGQAVDVTHESNLEGRIEKM